jgi:hypothetical protein
MKTSIKVSEYNKHLSRQFHGQKNAKKKKKLLFLFRPTSATNWAPTALHGASPASKA